MMILTLLLRWCIFCQLDKIVLVSIVKVDESTLREAYSIAPNHPLESDVCFCY